MSTVRRAPVSPGRMVAGQLFQAVWLVVGVVALSQSWPGMQSAERAGARASYQILAFFGLLALGTSATHGMRGKAFSFVGGLTGAVLGLYGIALVLMGHEDVGGMGVALPFGLGAIALSVWTLQRVVRRA